jgi:S1-C subfamily serine protease
LKTLTPVPFQAFPPIYTHLSVRQTVTSENVVSLNSPGIRSRKAASIATLATLSFALACVLSPIAAPQKPAQTNSPDDAAIASVCPVVYPDDQSPASRGYHYTFFGNAFFINDEGYLLTVAHVLETFRDGGQAYILVNRPNSPPQLLKVNVIAKDLEHDVAVLRAAPNPFASKHTVTFLSLASGPAVRGQSVLALSLHPEKIQDAHSFELQREDLSAGTILGFESTRLQQSGPAANVFLLSHPVVKGQSGSPVLDADSHAVVGLVEGLWLRGAPLSLSNSSALPTSTRGAAIPIQYALTLLKEHNVSWRSTPTSPPSAPPSSSAVSSSRPEW